MIDSDPETLAHPIGPFAMRALDRLGVIDEARLAIALAGGYARGVMSDYRRVARDLLARLESDGLIVRGSDGWYFRSAGPTDPSLLRPPARIPEPLPPDPRSATR